MIHECWRRMKVMNAEFEQSEADEGLRSCEPTEEQVSDEQAWSPLRPVKIISPVLPSPF